MPAIRIQHKMDRCVTFQALISTLLGVRVRVSGDALRADETALLLSNHRTRLDWNFLWAAAFHAGQPTAGHNLKLVLKDEVKRLPGIGGRRKRPDLSQRNF